jgi:hypothetical protein
MSDKHDNNDDDGNPFEGTWKPSSHVSIERMCEMDDRIRELSLFRMQIDDIGKDVLEILKDYTAQEIATYVSRLCVISDGKLDPVGIHHHLLIQERYIYPQIKALKQMKAEVSSCDRCPSCMTVLAVDPRDPDAGPPSQKKICYFLKEAPAETGRHRNCPFF